MEFVFNSPMATVEGQQALGVGSFGTQAGNPVDYFDGRFAFFRTFADDFESLFQAFKVLLLGQNGGGSQRSLLDASMSLVDRRGHLLRERRGRDRPERGGPGRSRNGLDRGLMRGKKRPRAAGFVPEKPARLLCP